MKRSACRPKNVSHSALNMGLLFQPRDPLLKKSYRGITLTSVLAKVLELVLMERISPLLEDAGVPQISQTAHKKGVSCQDSIFASQEANAKFISEGDNV